MTTKQSNAAELARIGDCDYVIQQAAAEGRAAETVWTTWEQLFFEGSAQAARDWWQTEIAPLFVGGEGK